MLYRRDGDGARYSAWQSELNFLSCQKRQSLSSHAQTHLRQMAKSDRAFCSVLLKGGFFSISHTALIDGALKRWTTKISLERNWCHRGVLRVASIFHYSTQCFLTCIAWFFWHIWALRIKGNKDYRSFAYILFPSRPAIRMHTFPVCSWLFVMWAYVVMFELLVLILCLTFPP